MSVLRDVFRRRLRSVLTICGVAVGVFALFVLGAMAEKAQVTLDTSAEYYADKITVVEKKAATTFGYNTSGGRPLTAERIAEVRAYPGILDVAPQVAMSLDEAALPLGVPSLVIGGFVGTERYPERWKAAEGRMLDESERGVAVVGPDLVKQLDAEVGGHITVRGRQFEVVGITAPSNTMIDQSVIVSLADARALWEKTLSPVLTGSVESTGLALQLTAYVKPGVDANELATRLNRDVPGVHATGPAELKKQLGQMVGVLSAILASVASIALVVGSLSVVNTMLMAMSERDRELGVKRALGASRWSVGRDVVAESAVMGALGGVVAIAVGWTAVAALNAVSRAGNGTTMFLASGRLAAGAMLFAVVIGALAGLYPAWRSARLDPASALAGR